MAKSLEENFIDWECSAFGFGYGSGEIHVLPALKKFFDLCPENAAYDYQVLEHKLTPTVAWLLINTLASDSVGCLQYGTSPRGAWLTKRGKALKAFIASKTARELIRLVTCHPIDYNVCYPNSCNCSPVGYIKGKVCDNPFWNKDVY
jgi:hypothetical protein